jgi:hypothetical protein
MSARKDRKKKREGWGGWAKEWEDHGIEIRREREKKVKKLTQSISVPNPSVPMSPPMPMPEEEDCASN